jgi:hypothetical protein
LGQRMIQPGARSSMEQFCNRRQQVATEVIRSGEVIIVFSFQFSVFRQWSEV